MEEVVAAARRIETILGEQGDSKMERLILSMQEQTRILTKDLKSAHHEQMAAQSAPATPTTALATLPAAAMAAAQPPPLAQPPPTATSYRSTTSIPTCSSFVPGLWGGRAILSATSPSTGKESPSLLFKRRGRALCIALSSPLLPPALAKAASARTRSRLATRTSAGTASGGQR